MAPVVVRRVTREPVDLHLALVAPSSQRDDPVQQVRILDERQFLLLDAEQTQSDVPAAVRSETIRVAAEDWIHHSIGGVRIVSVEQLLNVAFQISGNSHVFLPSQKAFRSDPHF